MSKQEGPIVTSMEKSERFCNVETVIGQLKALMETVFGMAEQRRAVHEVDCLERMNRKLARVVAEFWDAQPRPRRGKPPSGWSSRPTAKGCRAADQAPLEDHRPRKGPKPNRKKMATLGAVDTIERHRRTPEQIAEALFQDPKNQPAENGKRPAPPHKRVRASLARSPGGRTEPALEAVFGWMRSEIRARDPHTNLPLPCLMDGQGSLWEAAHAHLPQDHLVPIVDLLQVTPRLWKAAYLFYPEQSQAALDFVRDRVLRMLKGEVRSVSFAACAAGVLIVHKYQHFAEAI